MTIDISDIKCFIKLPKKKGGKDLAFAEVTIADTLIIKGFRISRTDKVDRDLQAEVWIQPPTIRRSDYGYVKVAYFNDPKLWVEIKSLIFEKYEELRKSIPFTK
jgi:DNA-binding cell septation regulator SpoVG